MSFQVSIIDDALIVPAAEKGFDDTKRFDENCLSYMVNSSSAWDDSNVQNLINCIILETSLCISGYTNPNIFNNEISCSIKPDIIIYDWDYKALDGTPEGMLLLILQTIFCFVYIYTGCDQIDSIKQVLQDELFKPYSNRIGFFNKNTPDSFKELIETINLLKESNLSFLLSTDIRTKSSFAVENILVQIGKTDIEKAIDYLNIKEANSTDLNSKNLLDFIGEKFKNDLSEMDFHSIVTSINHRTQLVIPEESAVSLEQIAQEETTPTLDLDLPVESDICRELWRYRLYFNPKDCYVRKGDIIKTIVTTI